MSKLVDYVIEGSLQNGDKASMAREKLAIHALVQGSEVAQSQVDPEGHYKLAFQYGEQAPQTDLRVGPVEVSTMQDLLLAGTVPPSQYTLKENRSVAELNIHFKPPLKIRHIDVTYHMFGKVFNNHVTDGLAGLKMDFYELPNADTEGPAPSERPADAAYLGTSYTNPSGDYTFTFVHTEILAPVPFSSPFVMVEFSQYINGFWTPIFVGPIDQLIPTEFRRGFVSPLGKIQPSPDDGVPPKEGFRFNCIGLLPFDEVHFIEGCFTGKQGDPQPVAGMTKRPLYGTLRIYGLFANSPEPVSSYKVQIARVSKNYVPGSDPNTEWEDITDPLFNLQFNDATKRWDPTPLGPSDAHLYKNVDRFPLGTRLEHSLKIIWNSANKPDGFYVLRFETTDNNNNKSHFLSPMICIDNSLPEVKLEAVGAKECGQVTLTGNELTFKVTAYDPDSHVLSYGINACAGRDTLPVAITVQPPKLIQVPGTGIPPDQSETIKITGIPLSLQTCSTLAYRFDLWVQGAATNGYGTPAPVTKSVNLIVAKS